MTMILYKVSSGAQVKYILINYIQPKSTNCLTTFQVKSEVTSDGGCYYKLVPQLVAVTHDCHHKSDLMEDLILEVEMSLNSMLILVVNNLVRMMRVMLIMNNG